MQNHVGGIHCLSSLQQKPLRISQELYRTIRKSFQCLSQIIGMIFKNLWEDSKTVAFWVMLLSIIYIKPAILYDC